MLSKQDYDRWRGEEGEGANWRKSPDVGVVTDDMHMWENLYPDAIARSYAQLLKFSDVFRIRIFMPLGRLGPSTRNLKTLNTDGYTYPVRPPVSTAIKNIHAKLAERSRHPEDYMFSQAQKPFYKLVLESVNLKQDVLFDSTSAGGQQKLAQVDPAPVNWAYTNMILNTAPAGWGEANYRSAEEIVQRRRSVVAEALGVSMATQLEEGYKVWSQTAFSES